MKKSNHIRGQWWHGKLVADPNNGQECVYVNATEDGRTFNICKVFRNQGANIDLTANANLIVHAEQMYECLNQVLSFVNGETKYDPESVVSNLRRLVAELDSGGEDF